MMKVARILSGKETGVITGDADMPVREAARTLAEKRIGLLVVTGADGILAGVFSERDIVRGLSEHGAEYLDMPVGEGMTRHPITCSPEHRVEDVMELMNAHGIRHLPVLGDDDKLIGVISMVDVVRSLLARAELDREMHRAAV